MVGSTQEKRFDIDYDWIRPQDIDSNAISILLICNVFTIFDIILQRKLTERVVTRPTCS